MANGNTSALGGLLAGGGIGALAGAGLGAIGAVRQKKLGSRVRRRTRKAIQSARAFAEQRTAEITGEGSLFALGEGFLRGTFENAADSPLAQDFAKAIRSGQAARGTFGTGNLAAQQEAIGQSALAQRIRQGLLPQVQNFAFAPEQLRQSIVQTRTPFEIQAAIGPGGGQTLLGGDILGGALEGALGGFQLGGQLGLGAFQAQESQRRNNVLAAGQGGGQEQDDFLNNFLLRGLQGGVQASGGIGQFGFNQQSDFPGSFQSANRRFLR